MIIKHYKFWHPYNLQFVNILLYRIHKLVYFIYICIYDKIILLPSSLKYCINQSFIVYLIISKLFQNKSASLSFENILHVYISI